MKIAFAIEHFSPDQGGAEQYAWAFARWLVDAGHELDVFTLRAPHQARFVSAMHILDVAAARGKSRQERVEFALRSALARRRYDVIQGFNHVTMCDVLRLGGGVHVAFEQYNALSASTHLGRSVKAWSYRMLPRYRAQRDNERRQFDDPRRHFIAVSHRVAGDMAHYYPSCASRIHVIHNGVDLQRFNPEETASRRAAARRSFGLHDDETAFLFVSNNYRLKGLHDLLRALALLRKKDKSFRLVVIGRSQQAPFARLASRLGVKDAVRFAGPVEDLRDGYAAADVLVHPSYYDAFGFVGIEAMACGLSVVCSRNCGVSEIMTDGQGSVLVDMPCSHEELADAMRRAADHTFRVQAREWNRRTVAEHRLEDNYRKVVALYDLVNDAHR
jgi:UDP-glucose:(heptosyl)LPS alpha-1,3-glucosyltransferase